MIKTFKNKQLAALWGGKRSKIDARMQSRILVRLDVLDSAESIDDLIVPGYNFHGLTGFNPKRYTIHINGPWCLTFEFNSGNAFNLDFEQYH